MNKNNEEDENRLIAERRAKLLTIRENKKVAFPNNFKPNTNASELQEKFIACINLIRYYNIRIHIYNLE